MATLEHLCATGKLKKHDADLEDDELPQRVICLAPEFEKWALETLPSVPRDRGRNLNPHEQVEQIFYEFVIGRPMAYGVHIRKLDPLGQHIWELKTEDMRIFGWLTKKAHFVAVCGSSKKAIPRARDYDPFIRRVAAFRAALDLDEPKSLLGVTLHEVL